MLSPADVDLWLGLPVRRYAKVFHAEFFCCGFLKRDFLALAAVLTSSLLAFSW